MYSKPVCSSFDELNTLLEKTENKANKEFDGLVSSLNINVAHNKQWADDYYRSVKECEKLERSIKHLKVWRWILIIFLIFPFFLMTNAMKKKIPILEEKKKIRDESKKKLDKQLNGLYESLSYEFAFQNIIEKVWPDIKLDLFMNPTNASNWEYDYAQYMPKDSCATSLISGSLFQHPFVIMNRKDQTWYPHVYTGSAPVTYTVHVDGKTQTRVDMVIATVTLPAATWSTLPYFLYRTSKPEELCFCNDLTKKQVKKQVKKMNYQAMDNPEFDKLFPASRNSEIEYRVVFTPFAQEAFVNLLKERQYSVEKVREVTTISSGSELIDSFCGDDFNYDLEVWKKKYSEWCVRLVRQIGVYSLPIANMPVYQQMSYKNHPGNKLSRLQFQDLAHWVCSMFNLWGNFETEVIFEPIEFRKMKLGSDNVNYVNVKCNYFHLRHRTEIVPTFAHGKTVMVPVHVIDYLPRSKNIYIIQSTSFNTNRKEVVSDTNWAIHSGQLVMWSFNPNFKALNKQYSDLENLYRKKK